MKLTLSQQYEKEYTKMGEHFQRELKMAKNDDERHSRAIKQWILELRELHKKYEQLRENSDNSSI